MAENVDLDAVKEKIYLLSQTIISQSGKVNISISDNSAVQAWLNRNTGTIYNAINNIVFGKGSSFADAITTAKGTLSATSQNSDRYMILVTDATDSIKEELDKLVDEDINVITLLYDITNNEIGTPSESSYGQVYMFENIDEEKIADYINKSLIDVELKDKLTSDIVKYFDIELLTENEDISISKDGVISYNIKRIANNQTLSVKYKLTLKDDAVIDRNVIFKNWFSAKEITVDYTKDFLQKQLKLEQTKTPIFTVCETYKMLVKAVNAENTSLGVAGIQFKIEGTDSEGNIIYSDTLTTDANGYVEVEKIKTLGKVTYSITPIINIVGYEETEARNIIVDNDYLGRRVLEVDGDGLTAKPNDIERTVEVEFPVNVQGFDLEINLNELDNSNVKLSNTEFRLIQPKLNNKYEMDVLYGKTDEKGQLFFHPAVMTKAGTYDYILSQMDEVTGYESMGNVTLRLTFNNEGKITKTEIRHNENVKITNWNEAYVQLGIGNKGVLSDAFELELNLTDKDTKAPIVGANYNVTVTTSNNTKYSYGNNVTDENGQIKLLLPGTGEVHIAIVEQSPAVGYQNSNAAKEFNIHRQDGEVKYAYGSNSSSTNYFDIICQSVDDKVVVNTESSLKVERNTVKIKAIDAVELPKFGIEDVQFSLVNTTNGKTYGPLETNYDGEVEFTIDEEIQGQYEYNLIVNAVPFGYVEIAAPIKFNIHFDEQGYIDGVNDLDPVEKIEYQLTEDETAKLHRAYMEIGIDIKANLAYNIQIALTDVDTGAPIEGAKYDFEVKYGNNTKKVTGRPTDANGMISTRVAIDKTKVSELEITVAQTSSKVGYKADLPTQEIVVNLLNNSITHTPEEVRPGNTQEGQIRYADMNGQTITYHHTNRKKDATDSLLNINVTTIDKSSDSVIGGKAVTIINKAVTDANGTVIKQILNSDGKDLDVTKLTLTDVPKVGYTAFENLQLIGNRIPGEQEYEFEMTVDNNLIRCRLTYKYNEYTQMVELVNVETVWGNRLIRTKNFSSYENEIGYISDINLEVYTYESGDPDGQVTGNLTLDLKKADLETKDTLAGAKYDIIIERPDGTKIVRSNVEVFEDVVELEGIYVPQDTVIYITESEAPLGYELNDTMILKVTGVDQYTNEVTLTKENDSYNGSRSQLVKEPSINISSSGMLQSQYTLNMYDAQMDKFRFKISTTDNVTFKGVSGFKFEIKNDSGAQKITENTNENGEVNTLVGGIYDDKTSPITYTITEINTGTYYKKLKTPIEVKVYFKADGTVDYDKTLKGQTDANYSETGTALGQWHFEGANKLDNNGNIVYSIAIIVNVETLDPLNVEIETVNKFTNSVVEDVEYTIKPSVGEAKGETNIQVNYAESNINRSYVVSQTIVPDNYLAATNLGFNITYDDDGNIASQPIVISPNMKVVSYQGKTIKLQVAIEPRVPITVTNLYYFNHDEVLQGGEFQVTGMKTSLQTNSDGQAKGVIGRFGEDEDVTYTITQTKAKYGYAEVDPFDIIVHYGENREITSVTLAEPNNRFVTVGYIQPSKASDYGYNKTDKGIITLTVLNYKAVTMNIKNVDRQDGKLLSGTQYSITSDINTSGNGTTDATGMALAYVGKSGFDKTVRYTIHEVQPAFGYQTFGTDIYLDVDFNEDGYITGCAITNNPKIDNVAQASTITPIVTIEDNFTINIELKSNPLMKFNITKVDMQNNQRVIKNVTFDVTGTLGDKEYTKDTVTTNQEGKVTAKVDRTLDNSTMLYTIKETKKSPFYEWLPEDIKLEISYDETGKMQKGENAYRVTSGNEYIDITNVDEDNYTIDMTIYNDEIKAFGIHIYTDDVYDDTKKLESATWEAWLTDRERAGHTKDSNYATTLISGRDSDGDGTPDLAHAEDYQIVGEYSGGAGTRTLRLTTSSSGMPNKYSYNDEWIKSAYGLDSYNMLIDIDFDDNGKIVGGPRLRTGDDSYIGWLLDGRYVEVSKVGDYGINITIHYYPKLQIAVRSYDMYTGAYTPANFQISTIGSSGDRQGVTSGYIGNNPSDGRHSTMSYRSQPKNTVTIDNFKALCFTDTTNGRLNREVTNENGEQVTEYGRYIYIYEMDEPSGYQKYRPRYSGNYYDRKLAKISVWYNEKGEVTSANVEEVYSNNNIKDIKVIVPEYGKYAGAYDANGNYIRYNDHNLYIDVTYAPRTTASITVKDAVSGAPIGEIKVYPYGGGTHQTSTSYEYRSQLYYETNDNGYTSWTYWGANVPGNKNVYKISLGEIEGGYLGSSSSESAFRYIEVEVSYDTNGRIGSARVLNKDGFDNVAAEVDESCYGSTQLRLTFKLQRKMGMQINKVDQYDNNIKLSAKFKVTNNIDSSGTHTDYTINAGSRVKQIAGRIIANNTVEYTLSEVTVPDGYKPLDRNLKLVVKYRANGTIETAYAGDEYSKEHLRVDYICQSARGDNSLLYKDIEITVYNEPKFAVELELTDKYYNNIKVDNVTFSMASSEGDVGVGNLVTNSSGKIYTYIGAVHPGKTVTYTLTQESKASGYYQLTQPIEFTVTFDSSGKPVDIPVLKGDYAQEYASVLTNNVTRFRTNYTASIRVYNMPEKVNLGITKYDWLTNEPIQDVQFKVTVEENGRTRDINNILTNARGYAIVQIDTFREEAQGRSVTYTIHEVAAPDSYRKTQDFQIQVLYDSKGGISSWQVLSNESNLSHTIYKRGNTSIQKMDDTYVHMILNVPNDNTYDLIVKDEDINYQGLGIQDTKYDISINGVVKNAANTSNAGYTKLANLTENGNIQIRIAERVIGEGYRENIENDVTLEIEKAAIGVYSLSLNTDAMTNYTITETANSTSSVPEYKIELTDDTYVVVSVNEEYGQVKVTFFNETKSELTLIKQDVNTKVSLQDVEFKITKKDLAKDEETVLTENSKTDADGIIYFDLGVAPQNTTVVYTFEELSEPEPNDKYQTLLPAQTVTVTYDIYGKVTNIITSSRLRTKAFLEHSNNDNCRSVITTIGNGTIEPKYTVKVVSEDVDTGRRINGSTFDVEVKNVDGDTLAQLPTNTLSNVTQNLCTDGKLHTDAEVEQGGLRIVEKGVIRTEGMNYKGEITIDVSQKGFAYGYVPGSQKVTGQVKLVTDFTANPDGSMDSILSMELKDNDGLEVTVDEETREIIITVKNESRVGLTIEKLSLIQNDDGSRNPIRGATFTVTSQILTVSGSTDTDLNVETRQTGVDGITSETIGKAYPGKTIVYTIHENELTGYEQIEDVQIAVVYDLKGNISYVELLSEYADVLNWTGIENSFNGTRDIRIPILNTPIVEDYQIVLEKHDIDDGLYPDLIPGAEYEITVAEQFGETKTWTAITNSQGKIYSTYFNGYGTINITIKEIDAPVGYELDPIPKYITLFRNKDSGVIQKYSSDVNIDVNDDNTVVTLKPLDKGMNNTYGLIIDKVDVDTGTKIVKDTAEFEVTITKQEIKQDENYEEPTTPDIDEDIETDVDIEEDVNAATDAATDAVISAVTDTNDGDNQGTQTVVTYRDTLEPMETFNGRAMIRTIYAPEEAGIYTYTIKETKVPEGYEKDPEEVVFEVEFEKSPEGYMLIKNVKQISGKYASILAVREDTLGFTLGNKNKTLIPEEDEYILNIYKVDENSNRIKDTAIFKVTMPDGTVKYVETDENSRLNLEHFKYPEQAETVTYVLQEIMAPEGYVINKEPITIKLEFIQNEEGKIVLNSSNIVITAPGKNVSSAKLTDGAININVTNVLGEPSTDSDRGRYNLILTKIDADTKQIIPREAEITVGLENGQRVLSRTKEDAKIKILEIKAPAKAGEYEYVIKETKAPDGYILNDEPQIFKITFEENPQDPTQLIITNAKEITNDTVTPIIHVTSYANNTVEINVENKKDADEPLYLKSKLDDTNEVIYNVYQKEDVPAKMPFEIENPTAAAKPSAKIYQVTVPTIDTKKMMEYRSHKKYKLGITVNEFIGNLDTNAEVITIYDTDGAVLIVANLDGNSNITSIHDANGNTVNGSDLIKTNCKLKATKGSEELNYNISVKGDVNGDGLLTTADSVAMKEILAIRLPNKLEEYNNWTTEQKMAMDVADAFGLLTTADSVAMKELLAKPIPTN